MAEHEVLEYKLLVFTSLLPNNPMSFKDNCEPQCSNLGCYKTTQCTADPVAALSGVVEVLCDLGCSLCLK